MDKADEAGRIFAELMGIMARLRGEQGCPWDKEQTHGSLKPSLLEETYEVLDAIDRGEPQGLKEELGDLAHQIIFHCQLAEEHGHFTAAEMLSELKEKIVRRHPHVFSDRHLPDTEAVLQNWARTKAEERGQGNQTSSLGELPRAMPALARAQRLSERASHLGFDWPTSQGVWEKVGEEMGELKSALACGEKRRIGEEMGDLLFTLVNLARFFQIEAEDSLTEAMGRFARRFKVVEEKVKASGKSIMETSPETLDSFWQEAKEATKT